MMNDQGGREGEGERGAEGERKRSLKKGKLTGFCIVTEAWRRASEQRFALLQKLEGGQVNSVWRCSHSNERGEHHHLYTSNNRENAECWPAAWVPRHEEIKRTQTHCTSICKVRKNTNNICLSQWNEEVMHAYNQHLMTSSHATYLSIHLSIHTFIHPTNHQSNQPSIHPSINLQSFHTSVLPSRSHPSVRPSFHPFIHPFIR